MSIDFTEQDIIFMYGHFKKHIEEVERIKAAPNNPFDEETINSELKLYSSITDKISDTYPMLKDIDKHIKKIVD